MLYTYTFNNNYKREVFANIVKEKGFSIVSMNSYTTSNTRTSAIDKRYVVTDTHYNFEITIDKDMTPEEESMFLKFARLYLLTKPSLRFGKMFLNFIIFFIVFGIFMAISENSFLSSIVSNDNFPGTAIMIGITSIVFYMIYKRIKDVQNYKIVKQNLKEIVMKEYLGEYGKRIISNY